MKQSATRCRWSVVVVAAVALNAAGCGWAEWPGSPTGSRGSPAAAPQGRAPETVSYADRPARVTVMSGDSVERLSQRYGAPARSIIELNNLRPPYRLYVGQSLALPRDREHVVRKGETLSELAERYHLDMSVLASANGLTRPYTLFRGQRLRVPEAVVPAAVPSGTELASRSALQGATVAPLAAPPSPSAQSLPPSSTSWTPSESDETVEPPVRRPGAASTTAVVMPKAPAAVGAPPPKSGGGFLWPTTGKVISRFGSKGSGLRNDGINIAAARGAPVRAAESGVVAYAGNELKAFGELVLIKHDGGWVTTYAHNDSIKVSRGDIVQKGQIIAEVGNSGSVSTPQLHFEMRKGKKAVDPLQYLPPGRV
jgi:murein DD-endopeptidase MepM/ murein hydrolase activator NlpD